MAKKEVVYTIPYSNQQIQDNIKEIIQSIPDYGDSGVAFKGYYKKKVSENNYHIYPQERFFLSRSTTNTGAIYYLTDSISKRLYITDIQLQWNINTYNSLNQLYIESTDAGHTGSTSAKLQIGLIGNSGVINTHYDVPVLIDYTKTDIYNIMQIGLINQTPTANDKIYLQITGFWEI